MIPDPSPFRDAEARRRARARRRRPAADRPVEPDLPPLTETVRPRVIHFRDLPPDEQARMRAQARTPEGRAFAAECEADAAYWDSLTDDERNAEFDRIMAEGTPVEVRVSPDLRVILLPDGWPDDDLDTP